jgi:hypothetical protein
LRWTSRRLDHLGALAEDVRVDVRATRDVVDGRTLVLDLKADLRAGGYESHDGALRLLETEEAVAVEL